MLCLNNFLGPDSLKTSQKHLCELGWSLAELAGWAEVEDVFANRGFFWTYVLCPGYQTNRCAFVKVPLSLTLLDAADCCIIQRHYCQFLEKSGTSFCLCFISGSQCETVGLVKSTGWLLGLPFPVFLVPYMQLRDCGHDHFWYWLNLLFLAVVQMRAASTSMS